MRDKRCKKSEMVREHSGMVDRARCRLPLGHKGDHIFADSAGDVKTRAFKDEQSSEAKMRLISR
jgi:hypothetical protein